MQLAPGAHSLREVTSHQGGGALKGQTCPPRAHTEGGVGARLACPVLLP